MIRCEVSVESTSAADLYKQTRHVGKVGGQKSEGRMRGCVEHHVEPLFV